MQIHMHRQQVEQLRQDNYQLQEKIGELDGIIQEIDFKMKSLCAEKDLLQ